MKAFNPRSVTDAERPWIEHWSPDAHVVLLREVRSRYSNRLGLSVCSYVATRAYGEDDGVSGPQKAEYRKILDELADAGVTPPPPGRTLVPVTPLPYDGVVVGRSGETSPGSPAPASNPAARRRSTEGAPAPTSIDAARRRRGTKVPDESIPGYRNRPGQAAPAFSVTTLREAA